VPVTRDGSLVAAPAWVPGKNQLFYTSYRSGYPDIYFQDLSSGNRRVIAKYPGLNTSAAVSSDGTRLAMILSKGGSPDLYVADIDGSNLRQLTKTKEDESSPCWSPDGKTICVVSAVSGRPALYLVAASGGDMRRLSTAGALTVTEPDWSPDGKWIAFTALRGRQFWICVVPAGGGDTVFLAEGEDPSWAPNSRTIIFSRTDGNRRRILSLLDVPTKRVKDVLQNSGNWSQPSWAK
jgi:TolB protein